jgi:hypothetical protein
MRAPIASSLFLLSFGLAVTACGDDAVQSVDSRKGEIDRPALESGVTVTISGDVGTVTLPFLVSVPEVGGDTGGGNQLEDELSTAVSLVVTSNSSGATADLAAGILTEDSPSSVGQWNWTLNDDRDEATMTFFNSTVSGLTLKSSVTYDAALSIASNEYVETEDAFSFTVTVVGN